MFTEKDVVPVVIADAVAELSVSTQDPDMDFLHMLLIDLLQTGDLKAARDAGGTLRFAITELGAARVRERQG